MCFDDFAKMFVESEEKEHEQAREFIGEIAEKAKVFENLNIVISELMNTYGDTVPNSFIIFPLGGKKHMLVSATPSLKATLETLTKHSVTTGIDLNILLGGLLAIGLHNTKLKTDTPDKERIIEAGSIEGSSDIESLTKE